MGGTGVELRMQILRDAADQQILKPLRSHGWEASVITENTSGEYIVIEANRSNAVHKIALLYSSATSNGHYKDLDRVVEHIFTNGELYRIESYAYGINAKVTPIDDFFPLLVQWNKGIAPPGEPARKAPSRPRNRAIRHITAETPIDGIWARLDQFASRQLAEKLVLRRAQEESIVLNPSAVQSKASGVAYAIRNASDYFRSLPFESLNKRTLSLYYGVLALAFAEMLASPRGPTDLDEVEGMTKQGHGLYTVPSVAGDLGGINVGVLASGFFPRWVTFLGHDTAKFPKAKPKTPSDIEKLAPGTASTFGALLASIPELGDLFLEVFDLPPSWVVPEFGFDVNSGHYGGKRRASEPDSTYIQLIDPSKRITDETVRAAGWPIAEVTAVPEDEHGRAFQVRVDHAGYTYWHEALPIHHSPFDQRPTLIVPVLAGISEYRAIATSILYTLSILVRYMPSVWRRVEGGDWDQHLAMIKAAVAAFERVLPEEFLESIIGERINARQPGTL